MSKGTHRSAVFAAAVITVSLCLPAGAPADASPATHRPVLLPDLGYGGEAVGIDDRGDIVGNVIDSSGAGQAAIWRHGTVRVIRTGYVRSTALDVDDAGLVVGQGQDASHLRHGWAWWRGRLTVLRVPFAGATDVQVRRLDHGEIVGTVADARGLQFAVVWRTPAGEPRVLRPLRGEAGSFGHGLNDEGVVAGTSDAADGTPVVPTIWRRGVPSALPMVGGPAEAWAINDRGAVVGTGYTGDPAAAGSASHFLAWKEGRVRDLGALPGDDDAGALAVNDRNVAVGFSASDLRPSDSGEQRAVVSFGFGRLHALPTPAGTTFAIAHDVNDADRIVGAVSTPDGGTRAVLW